MPSRFLIIRGGAIGDFILTVPVMAALRAQWPDAHIEVLGYPHIADLAKGPELVNAVRSISSRGVATFFADRGEQDAEFREYFHSFQQVISFLYDPDEVFQENVRRAGVKHYLQGIHKPFEPEPPEPPVHAARQLVKVLESIAVYVEEPVPRLYTQRAERLVAHDFFKGGPPRPLVAVHPGSGGTGKIWAISNWVGLCRWLARDRSARLLLIGGEADQVNLKLLQQELTADQPLVANSLKLPQLAAVLEQATAFVGHDSGISHLAAALGVPSVVLFGPTNPAVWRPLGPKVRVIQGAKEWSPDSAPYFIPSPMTAIRAHFVQDAIKQMLAAVG